MKRFNWLLLGGLAVLVVAVISYFAVFARFAITRDVPWASFLLLALGAALLAVGWRRSQRKILASIVCALGLVIIGGFTWIVTFGTKGLPRSGGAPAIGSKAPDFTLPDANGSVVRLSDVLAKSNGVLLVFYRGYW